MKTLSWFSIAIALFAGCSQPPGPRPIVYYKTDFLSLADTGFEAFVCTGCYCDYADSNSTPDLFTISVEQTNRFGSLVCYERNFPASDVPAAILTAKARDVVTFERAKRLVTFKIGTSKYTYTLPAD